LTEASRDISAKEATGEYACSCFLDFDGFSFGLDLALLTEVIDKFEFPLLILDGRDF
jgi:hypothetical protein